MCWRICVNRKLLDKKISKKYGDTLIYTMSRLEHLSVLFSKRSLTQVKVIFAFYVVPDLQMDVSIFLSNILSESYNTISFLIACKDT